MNKVFASAVVASSVLVGSAVAASATPIPLILGGTVVAQDGSQYNSPKETSPFSDTYSFILLKSYDVSASFSGQFSLIGKNLANLTKLTFGIFDASNVEVLPGTIGKQGASLTGSTDDTILAPGTYSIRVTDMFKGGTGTYNGTLSLSAVPLPSSVAMFGVAIAALGVASAARRKAGKASAAV